MENEKMIFVNGVACLPDSFHAKWIRENGSLIHDKWLMEILKNIVCKGDYVIDAGAHIGTHTLWYSNQVGVPGRVWAFEANPNAFECLKMNCGGLKNVNLFNLALGAKAGAVDVEEVVDNFGMSYTKPGKDVPMITIDSLNLNKLDFMKIDCEGAEPDILTGAFETLKKLKPILLIEINKEALKRNGYTENDVYEKLHKLQYSFRNISGEPMDGVQFDIICQ